MRRPRLRRIPRKRGAFSGFLLILLGLWGALVPFVGPYFNLQIGTTDTWDWSVDRLWLSVLPGVVTVIGGFVLLYSTRRSSASLGGLLALAGGLWFVAGPTMSILWNDGVSATGPAIGDSGTRVLEWIAFFYGTGALITLFSSYALGFLAALPVTGEAVAPTAAASERAEQESAPAPAAAAATPTTAEGDGRPTPPPATRRRRRLRWPTARRGRSAAAPVKPSD
jgi:hypothetical protein